MSSKRYQYTDTFYEKLGMAKTYSILAIKKKNEKHNILLIFIKIFSQYILTKDIDILFLVFV